MEIRVKPLSSDLASEFTDYLEGLSFNHEPHWAGCYCQFYHFDCTADVWQKRSGEQNKIDAIAAIEKGEMKGYLAYDGDKCIGWCNANKASRYARLMPYLEERTKDRKVGVVICFVIHEDYRKQGVARRLLKEAIMGFRKNGFEEIIALPMISLEETDPEKRYRGTMNMYIEAGFKLIEKQQDIHIMSCML